MQQRPVWYGGLPVQPEDDYAVTVMSEKTEADASEGEKQAENDTNQSLDVSKQEKSTQEQLEKNLIISYLEKPFQGFT